MWIVDILHICEYTLVYMQSFTISGKLLAKNTLINFIGRILPLIVGVVAIPFIVQGLGTERFGLLSLSWIVLGYFTVFDLGLGRATTRYVAKALGKGETHTIPHIAWTAFILQLALGIIGSIITFIFTPLLVTKILNISPELLLEARKSFYILAFSVPVVLISTSFSGILEASQRFDLINIVKVPVGIMTFLLPVIGFSLHLQLPGIILLILIARICALITLMLFAFKFVPHIKKFSASMKYFKKLLGFGSWVTVSNIIGPLLQYLDRFIIGAVLSMTVVAYYTAPFDVISRIWIIPISFVMTMFPAFSSLGTDKLNDLRNFFLRSVKYMFLIVSLVIGIIIVFSRELILGWLGQEFATQSTAVLQILAIGVLLSSLTHLMLALFQGIGHPDITAKIQLILLPISIILSIILIKTTGIVGAAISWTVCRAAGMSMSWGIVWRKLKMNNVLLSQTNIMREIVWFTALALLLIPLTLAEQLYIKIAGIISFYSLFLFIAWSYVLDHDDKRLVSKYLSKIFHRSQYVKKNSHNLYRGSKK